MGDFWETAERRRIAPFTTALNIDKFKLMTIPDDDAAPSAGFPKSFPTSRRGGRGGEARSGGGREGVLAPRPPADRPRSRAARPSELRRPDGGVEAPGRRRG